MRLQKLVFKVEVIDQCSEYYPEGRYPISYCDIDSKHERSLDYFYTNKRTIVLPIAQVVAEPLHYQFQEGYEFSSKKISGEGCQIICNGMYYTTMLKIDELVELINA